MRLPLNGRVIGWVGRLSHEKGPDVAIDAIARVNDASVRLCILGDGPMLSACREQARALGADDRITFAGALPNAEAYLNAFDLMVSSSRSEGTPMVLLEALAAGVPLIATAVGGVPELLQGTGYVTVPPEDPVALSEQIERSLLGLASLTARAESNRLDFAARAAAHDWTAEYDAVYRSLITGR